VDEGSPWRDAFRGGTGENGRVLRRGAVFSRDRRYRYRLTRRWADGPTACFVMLNPSTADHRVDDPTVRRCIAYARRWGFGGLVVVNLFALRSTLPGALLTAVDPVGPGNDRHVARACREASLVVAAWGAHRSVRARAGAVAALLGNAACLGWTRAGEPRHPLYLRRDARPRAWRYRGKGRSSGVRARYAANSGNARSSSRSSATMRAIV